MPPTHVVGWLALVYALGGILPLLLFRVYVRRLIASQTPLRTRLFSSSASATKQKKIVGFFHPYWYVYYICFSVPNSAHRS
jgi:hypothetical protein